MGNLIRGDIVFVRGRSLISDAIELVTHSPYSHVALAVSPGRLIEAQGGRVVGYQSSAAYVGSADVFRTSLDTQTLDRVVAKAESHIGEPYDYFLDALEFVRCETGIQLPYRERHDLICSMLIADAFRPEYNPCPGIEYPTPGDLSHSVLWGYQFSY